MESKLHENLFLQEKSWISMRLRVDLTPECLDEWIYFA
jgi:hypothetical protein